MMLHSEVLPGVWMEAKQHISIPSEDERSIVNRIASSAFVYYPVYLYAVEG